MKKEDVLKANLMIVAGLLILFLLTKHIAFAYSSLLLLLICLFIPPVALWIAIIWNKFAEFMGAINSRIILSVIFFIILLPVAFVFRLFKKDPMHLKHPSENSLYTIRNHKYTAGDLKNVW